MKPTTLAVLAFGGMLAGLIERGLVGTAAFFASLAVYIYARVLIRRERRNAMSDEHPDCRFCGPCVCDDECGCVPGPCSICEHESEPSNIVDG